MSTTRVRLLTAFALFALLALPVTLQAEHIVNGTSVNGLGTFSADFGYVHVSPTAAAVTVSITNTTEAGSGGYLTGFAFNLPDADISGVGLWPFSHPDFGLLGGPSFSESVHASPFGFFDVGTSVGPTWSGSTATESMGLATGETGSFAFVLTGTGLDTLTSADFVAQYSTDPGIGGSQFFAARFRNIEFEGEDYNDAAGGVVENPEPGTLTLGLLGLCGAGVAGWRRSRKKNEQIT